MIKNYFKTAFRNLLKNKFYTSINILGLAVGLATCLLIFLYVIDELNRTGDDLDVSGSELDDENENIGEEDEENNYYSLGGDKDNIEDDPASSY